MSIYRHPKTTQEMRFIAESEYQGVPVRAKRNKDSLPNAWWDIVIPKSVYKYGKKKKRGKGLKKQMEIIFIEGWENEAKNT